MNKKQDTTKLEALEASTQTYWRSLADREGQAEFSADMDYEYTPSAEELKELGLNRRTFVGLMGASMALAGLTATGCIRKPVERILPYNRRPEDIIPGNPIHFATAMNIGRSVEGLVVVSQEGRPTKVEGNKDHPITLGATSAFAQASVLDLYDPDRAKKPTHAGRETDWTEFFSALDKGLVEARKDQGAGLALVVEETPSPTFHALLAELKKKLPKSRVFVHDIASPINETSGLASIGVKRHRPLYQLQNAKRIVGVGSDFLGMEGDTLLNCKNFSKGRDLSAYEDAHTLSDKELANKMNRLYIVEAGFSSTGMSADHRLRVRASEQPEFLAALAGELLRLGLKVPAGSEALAKQLKARSENFKKTQAKHSQDWKVWIEAVAEDLKSHAGASAVLVGESLEPRAHALGVFINALLQNIGKDKPVQFFPKADEVELEGLQALVAAINSGSVKGLVMMGVNPVYSAPADLNFAAVLDSVPFSVHMSYHYNETSKLATWQVPMNHYLESWGDLRSTDGTVSIQQPLVAPLYGTLSALELLAHLVGDQPVKGHQLVQGYWKQQIKGISFDRKWRRWLHEGFIGGTRGAHGMPTFKWDAAPATWSDAPGSSFTKGVEVLFKADSKVYDGRFANNAWMQELPDPLSKLTWDNAAWINAATAKKSNLDNGEWITLKVGSKKLNLPVYIVPGLAEDTVVLPLGYGHNIGRIAKDAGFNVYPLRTSSTLHFAGNASFSKIIGKDRYLLASTQEHGRKETSYAGFGSLEVPTIMGVKYGKRDSILRQSSLKEYQEDPKRFEKMEVMPKKKLKSLWKEPNETSGQQWGMAIDLTRCNGCSACVVACQAENNTPVVGKERVRIGREMHWVRIDRYFNTDSNFNEPSQVDDVEVINQPMACVHCENAPCENVCPVAATTHTPSGLNDMAYNRCIGTRYCSNNCPYKVRRFNYFNYTKENDGLVPAMQMLRNPDVTVRFRGVMEKCSYCVQRINAATIKAKAEGNGFVKDGDIVAACQQVCSFDAVAFGDITDETSKVSKAKKRDRNYAVLAELNNKPRTTYLARIRNRNAKLQLNAMIKQAKTKKQTTKSKHKG